MRYSQIGKKIDFKKVFQIDTHVTFLVPLKQ